MSVWSHDTDLMTLKSNNNKVESLSIRVGWWSTFHSHWCWMWVNWKHMDNFNWIHLIQRHLAAVELWLENWHSVTNMHIKCSDFNGWSSVAQYDSTLTPLQTTHLFLFYFNCWRWMMYHGRTQSRYWYWFHFSTEETKTNFYKILNFLFVFIIVSRKRKAGVIGR